MGNKPLSAACTATVESNDVDTLKKIFSSIPADQVEKVKAVLNEVKTPRGEPAPKESQPPANEEKKTEATEEKKTAVSELTTEQLENVRLAFDAIDKDKNGTIEVEEFKKVMLALDVTMTDEECIQVFKSFDVNGDSKLQFEEYCALIMEAMK
mmetsp:Transcript_32463/g.51862  ORF Transcript_32463/g.51862 Transcript_32463/m.51862 type:complete len:153 (+) Transcript_32463:88-546(+)|eukprot:CAMPEP_0169132156 /NCGR_PEP_ID=MMETSP1015-20121227/38638_1 /TAXON_ID=342587 /ORGANISM="Karlodinium micrum, Strain CCMP2283" /LENGTH=152 /DNA_ID=CAMNT_0009196481 /DNA_START=83 /DNA_END=541 /DNA_ORIENTATION=+